MDATETATTKAETTTTSTITATAITISAISREIQTVQSPAGQHQDQQQQQQQQEQQTTVLSEESHGKNGDDNLAKSEEEATSVCFMCDERRVDFKALPCTHDLACENCLKHLVTKTFTKEKSTHKCVFCQQRVKSVQHLRTKRKRTIKEMQKQLKPIMEREAKQRRIEEEQYNEELFRHFHSLSDDDYDEDDDDEDFPFFSEDDDDDNEDYLGDIVHFIDTTTGQERAVLYNPLNDMMSFYHDQSAIFERSENSAARVTRQNSSQRRQPNQNRNHLSASADSNESNNNSSESSPSPHHRLSMEDRLFILNVNRAIFDGLRDYVPSEDDEKQQHGRNNFSPAAASVHLMSTRSRSLAVESEQNGTTTQEVQDSEPVNRPVTRRQLRLTNNNNNGNNTNNITNEFMNDYAESDPFLEENEDDVDEYFEVFGDNDNDDEDHAATPVAEDFDAFRENPESLSETHTNTNTNAASDSTVRSTRNRRSRRVVGSDVETSPVPTRRRRLN